jgi:hypothetical protein
LPGEAEIGRLTQKTLAARFRVQPFSAIKSGPRFAIGDLLTFQVDGVTGRGASVARVSSAAATPTPPATGLCKLQYFWRCDLLRVGGRVGDGASDGSNCLIRRLKFC